MRSNITTSIIFFSPPNTHRLRYFSLIPINLATLPPTTETVALSTKLSQMEEVWKDPREEVREVDQRLEVVLRRMNKVQELQNACRKLQREERVHIIDGTSGTVRESSVVFKLLESVARRLETLVKIGRYPLFQSEEEGISLATLSATCE